MSAKPIDSRPLHVTTQAALLALLPPYEKKDEAFLRRHIDAETFAAANQGNAEISEHAISRSQCLAGLKGIVLQTPEQKRTCGHENMVPISKTTCIDIFEFPNRACELPFVWVGPTPAQAVCKKLGKRLCTDKEWMHACGGDPDGGEPQAYAYGDTLDLTICNTNKSRKRVELHCVANSVKTAWKTCATNTEPSGAFPRCRSRYGVFDMHGNVAEEMTRRDPDGKTYSQLKGSAFFYVDVHRKLKTKPEKTTYPDHCTHNPRWHVEHMRRAWHVNYHLGFRCCANRK